MYALRTAKRFSFLLLEEDEDFLQEYICICRWPKNVPGNWNTGEEVHGTLRVCTKSLFFEADDIRIPVIRIPVAKVESLEPVGAKTFSVSTLVVVKMKENNQDHPYIFERGQAGKQWSFTLPNRSIDDVIGLAMQQMLLKDDSEGLRSQAWNQLSNFQFDTSRLVKRFSEKIELEEAATQLTPLVRQPGKLVITDSRVYFQPLNSVSGTGQVLTHPMSAIAAVARRRYALKPVGLEIFFYDPSTMRRTSDMDQSWDNLWDAPSALFVFQSVEARESIATQLLTHKGSENTGGAIFEVKRDLLAKVTRAWQLGRISNFDYLLYLNLAAGRSFNDLTQWPVFPWILSDYDSKELNLEDPATFRDLSKPVGALNPERLDMLRKRYREMPSGDGMPPKFLYGTHYSTPGYVMFWLLRSAPGRVLQLQNGRFDAPDRLFYNVAEAWESVNRNPADVKELIPEFFLPSADFLLNKSSLALGKRQNGKPVGNVELPAWAKGPSDFLAKHRAALESPHVSGMLHKWIDLIFGSKQRGEAAVEADNLFYYLSYEGGVDIEQVKDPMERRAIESQINEFGQTPMQLFTQPHPRRRNRPVTPDPESVFHLSFSEQNPGNPNVESSPGNTPYDTSNQSLAVALLSAVMSVASSASIDALEESGGAFGRFEGCSALDDPVPEPSQTSTEGKAQDSNPPLPSGPYAAVLQQWSFIDQNQSQKKKDPQANNAHLGQNIRASVTNSVKGINSGIKALVGQFKGIVPGQLGSPASARSISWNEYLPHKMQRKISLTFPHGGINALASSSVAGGTLYCAGHNATLRLVSMSSGSQIRCARIEVDSGAGLPLSSIDLLPVSSEHTGHPIVISGSYDNLIYAYSAEFGRLEGHFGAHDNAVSQVKYVRHGSQKLISASWDCTVKVWELEEGRHPWHSDTVWPSIEIADHDSGVWAMDVSSDGNLVISGTDEGNIAVWDLRDPNRPVWMKDHCSDYIGGLAFAPNQTQVMVSSADGRLSMLSMEKSGKEVVSANCGSPLRCCQTDGYLGVAGSENGNVYVWNVGQQMGVAENPNAPITHPDGLFDPIRCASGSAVNAVLIDKVQASGSSSLWLSTGHEEGEVLSFCGVQS